MGEAQLLRTLYLRRRAAPNLNALSVAICVAAQAQHEPFNAG